MIGNDIVDLCKATEESNINRRRFLDKILTKKEQNYLAHSNDFFKTVWRFWSMKESAYKACLNNYDSRFFAPLKFECEIINEAEGAVSFKDKIYKTITKTTENYIYTTAINSNLKSICSQVINLNKTDIVSQSQLCYKNFKSTISKEKGIKASKLIIKKNDVGIPSLFLDNSKLAVSFSLTHHGNYGAFAFVN